MQQDHGRRLDKYRTSRYVIGSMIVDTKIKCGDCVVPMQDIESDSIDLTVTSPPYNDLRDYKRYTFDFDAVAIGLLRVIKPGGVVVWTVGDRINDGRSLTSFRQGIGFQARHRLSGR